MTGVHCSRFLLPNSCLHDSRVPLVQDSICDPENPEIHVVGRRVPMPLPDLAHGNVTGVHRPRFLLPNSCLHDPGARSHNNGMVNRNDTGLGDMLGALEEQIQTSSRQAQAIILGPTMIFPL